MPAHTCCQNASIRVGEKSKIRRVIAAAKWIVPTAILALLPKCPMCLAGYIALGSGLGISLPLAIWLRGGLILICFASLTWLAAASARRVIASRRHRPC
jgi:hypothetical protein